MSKTQSAGDGESAHGQHTSAEAKQAVMPLNPAFKQRFGPVGEALAKELAAFSLDVVGIVAAYAVCGVATAGARPQELFSFGKSELVGVCLGVASSPDGSQLWASSGDTVEVFDADGKQLFSVSNPAVRRAHSFAFEVDGTLFVSCQWDHCIRIVACNTDASVLRTIGFRHRSQTAALRAQRCLAGFSVVRCRCPLNYRGQVFNKTTAEFVRTWGGFGEGDGQFSLPFGVAISAGGEVFVFDVSGAFLRKFGSKGSGPGQFQSPMGVAIDRAGSLFVCEYHNPRVQVLTPQGAFITEFGCPASFSICLDKHGRILVGCTDGMIRVFAFAV